jgi:glycosyltransferase involved in cell wall biosynthesis
VGPNGSVTQVSERLRGDPRVTLLEHRLSNEEYAKHFSETDFIVLPYRKSTYFNRISGVAVEAAVSGKPILVTQNTWLEWALKEFASGIAVREGSPEGLCVALEKCIDDREKMIASANARAQTARSYNSSENYLTRLWH